MFDTCLRAIKNQLNDAATHVVNVNSVRLFGVNAREILKTNYDNCQQQQKSLYILVLYFLQIYENMVQIHHTSYCGIQLLTS